MEIFLTTFHYSKHDYATSRNYNQYFPSSSKEQIYVTIIQTIDSLSSSQEEKILICSTSHITNKIFSVLSKARLFIATTMTTLLYKTRLKVEIYRERNCLFVSYVHPPLFDAKLS